MALRTVFVIQKDHSIIMNLQSRQFSRKCIQNHRAIKFCCSVRSFGFSSTGSSDKTISGTSTPEDQNDPSSNKPKAYHKNVKPQSQVKEWGRNLNFAKDKDEKVRKPLHRSSEDRIALDNIFSDFNKERIRQKVSDGVPEISRPYKKQEKTSSAAVLVPFCHVNGVPSLLFMMRSMHLKNHRGEISFPGGMQDDGDRDVVHTALRETYEEIGFPAELVDVWCEIWASPSTMAGSWVTPILGFCGEVDTGSLTLNKSEVDAVFTAPISVFCDPAHQRQTQWRYPGTSGYTLPVFTGGEHRIWGLTAVILHQVLTLLAPGLYKFKLTHQS